MVWLNKHYYIDFVIPVLISFAAYMLYIKMPMDDYDNWLQNIAFGGYSFNLLPQNLKNYDVPTTFHSYLDFFSTKIGRIGGHAFGQYLFVNLFDRNVVLWRSFSIFLIIVTIILIKNILDPFKINKKHKLWFLSVTPFILNYNFILIIYSIKSLTNLFILGAFCSELKNNSYTEFFKYRLSLSGALLVFLTLLYHEISFAYGISIFLLILFWNHSRGEVQIKSLFLFKRMLPYLLLIFIYLVLFFVVYFYFREDTSYAGFSNLALLQVSKKFLIKFLLFFGFNISSYFGFLILSVFILPFLYLILIKRTIPDDLQIFKLVFSLVVVFSSSLIISLLSQNTTGTWIIQILAVFILYSTLYEFILINVKNSAGIIFKIVTILLFAIVTVFNVNRTFANLKYWEANNIAFNKLTNFLVKNIPNNGNVILNNISIPKCYSICGDIFLKGRIDDIKYLNNNSDSIKNPYLDSIAKAFNRDIIIKNPDFIITETCNSDSELLKSFSPSQVTIVEEVIKLTILDKLFLNLKNTEKIKSGLKSIIFKTCYGHSQNSFFTKSYHRYFIYKVLN